MSYPTDATRRSMTECARITIPPYTGCFLIPGISTDLSNTDIERCRQRPTHSLQDGRAPPAKRKYQFLGPRGRSTHAMHTASGGQHGEGQKKCKRGCPRGRIGPPQMQGSIYMCAASRPQAATQPHEHRRGAAQVQSEGVRGGPGGPNCSSPIAAAP